MTPRTAPSGATRAAAVLIALLLAMLALPGMALAHANLDRSEPAAGADLDAPPSDLHLFFSEAVDSSFSRVQLLNARGEAVDRGDSRVSTNDPREMLASLPDLLPDGVYTVAWRTLSAVDGHTVNGAYPIIIGPVPAEGIPVAATASSEVRFSTETALARWWFYLSASVVLGTLLAWEVVMRPLFGTWSPTARPAAARRARQLTLIAASALLVGTLYAAIAQAAVASDLPIWNAPGAPLVDLLSRGRYAGLWWARLGLVVLTLVLVAWRGVGRTTARIAMAATALAMLTSSLNSHQAALLSGAYLGVAADWLHLMAAAAWVGGLAGLAYVLPTAVEGSPVGRERVIAVAVARFSNLALIAVGVIVVSGVFQAWLQVGSWEGLVQTAYGLSVTAKVGLMVVALVLGAFNLLVVRPKLALLAGKRSAEAAALAGRFGLAVRGELALLAVVLGVAAILTGVAPAREELARRSGDALQAGPVDRQLSAEGLPAVVQITPNTLGINRFAVQLPETDPSQVERVQLTLTYLDQELGSQPLVLQPSQSAARTWESTSPLLSQAGTWQAELLVRRTGQDDARSAIRFIVVGAGGAPQPAASVAGAYPLLPSPMLAVAYALVGAGAVVLVLGMVRAARQGRRGRRALQRQSALLGAGLLVVACGGYVYAQEQRNGVPLDVANIRDPVPPDERSLASGGQVYTTNCEACHGETGRGDGPAGLRLNPRPADLRIHTAPGVHTDGELFYWVSYGYPGTAMPAWKDTLTEEQRWDVINYIRATFGNAANQPGTTGAPASTSPSPAAKR